MYLTVRTVTNLQDDEVDGEEELVEQQEQEEQGGGGDAPEANKENEGNEVETVAGASTSKQG